MDRARAAETATKPTTLQARALELLGVELGV
jgi:hypothetical protein